MKKAFWILAVAAATLLSCNKYDDSAIRQEISNLETRVKAVEDKVDALNKSVEALKTLTSKLNEGCLVVDVKKTADGYTIYLSDNTSVTIANGKEGATPVVGATVIDGVYYLTVDGQVVKDASGNPVPLSSAGILFRAGADGTIEYSVDGGKTWQPATASTTVELEETETAYVLKIGETSIELPKAAAFTLKVQVPTTFIIGFGETASVAYTILGVAENEATEVDVLNNGQGFTAVVTPSANNAGSISITNNKNAADESIKVFVYATNHTGKSDIKAIVFKTEQGPEPIEITFEAVLDAELVPADGGVFTLSVSSDEEYEVSADQDWISVASPTRALYEDALSVTVAANETLEQRSGTITVASKESERVKTVAVLQEAGEEPEPPVDPYLANTGVFQLTATGKYHYISNGSLKSKSGSQTFVLGIFPYEDGEDGYTGALFKKDGETFICYLNIARDEESGYIGLLAVPCDEWEDEDGNTVEDWQYATVLYQNDLHFIQPGGEGTFVIGIAEPINEEGIITFEAGDPLNVEGVDDPLDITGLDVFGLIDGKPSYFYVSIPFPATLTKLADLEEDEETETAVAMKKAMRNRPARRSAQKFMDSSCKLIVR